MMSAVTGADLRAATAFGRKTLTIPRPLIDLPEIGEWGLTWEILWIRNPIFLILGQFGHTTLIESQKYFNFTHGNLQIFLKCIEKSELFKKIRACSSPEIYCVCSCGNVSGMAPSTLFSLHALAQSLSHSIAQVCVHLPVLARACPRHCQFLYRTCPFH